MRLKFLAIGTHEQLSFAADHNKKGSNSSLFHYRMNAVSDVMTSPGVTTWSVGSLKAGPSWSSSTSICSPACCLLCLCALLRAVLGTGE